MFIRNAWYVAAWSNEIMHDKLFARELLGTRLVFYRREDGIPVALDDRCCHRFAPLSHGRVEGDCVRCMYHGLTFDPNGVCVEIPGQERIPSSLRVRSYPLVEQHSFIWIWMGEAGLADPQLIHDAQWHVNPDWRSQRNGYIHYKSNCQLVVDNLLDFSHLAYVHGQSIGSASFAQQRPLVERGNNQLTVSFALQGIKRPVFLDALSHLPEQVDRSNHYDWYVKGNFFRQNSVISPAGSGDYESTRPETLRLRSIIALTPETENTTHYFWSITHNLFATSVSDATAQLAASVAYAFEEDRVIIDAQQVVVSRESGDIKMMPIMADSALLQIRGMEAQLLELENITPGHANDFERSKNRLKETTAG
jgi:phenylpropionate dioxygenase-like ring-hydroxylating dioxygenase large terminal subunit